jgi:hypothetical protein
MKMKGKVVVAAAALLGFAAVVSTPSEVFADSISVTATFDPLQPNTVGTSLTSNYNNGYQPDVTIEGTVAGIYGFTVGSIIDNPTGPQSPVTIVTVKDTLGTHFGAVCIDFTHNIYYGQTATWNVENLSDIQGANDVNGVEISTAQQNAIEYLWTNHILNGQSSPFDTSETPNPTSAEFQLAVWDILYNGGGIYSTATTDAPTVSYGGDVHTDGYDTIAACWAKDAYHAVTNSSNPYIPPENAFALVATDVPSVGGPTPTQSFTFLAFGSTSSDNKILPVPLPASAGVGFTMLGAFGVSETLRKRFGKKLQFT